MVTHGSAKGSAEPAAPGILIDRARLYEVVASVLFLGRRRRAFRALSTASGAGPGDRVLDVGCGTGYFARLLAAAVGPGGQVIGMDASASMVADARRRAARLRNCRFEVGPAQSLHLPEAAVDVVTSTLMMHHLPADARPAALAEMYRVLRPGGRLLIADFQPSARGLVRHVTAAFVHASAIPFVRRAQRHHQYGNPMLNNDMAHLAVLIREAGFTEAEEGEVLPWLRYVAATRPA